MVVVASVAVIVGMSLSVVAGVQAAGAQEATPQLAAAAELSEAVASTSSSAAAVPATVSAAVSPDGAGPHPGTLAIYEDAGGGTTMDPASAYNTVNAEPIWNVYETLVAYNGSSTGGTPSNFVPQLATCVPGSAECTTQFGESLAFANSTYPTQTQYYTFEIDANARFYDPNTSASWPVYPSDVVFSFARTMAFSLLPFREAYPGWIQTQALLPNGSATWDGGIHYPYNNTPVHIMSAILVNDSAYCPAPTDPSIKTNGCVTFNVGPSGIPWPDFLQLVADPMGGAIVPCGKFTAVGAGVPGFNGTTAAHGDGSCTLPYGATSTSQSSYTRYLASLSPTGWDAYEEAGGNSYPSAQPAVQWSLYGSGPYYATEVNPSEGYFLKANPAYKAPEGCAGQPGCLPAPGDYQGTVDVYWSTGDTEGLQQMAGGYADSADVFPADFGTLNSLVASGKYGLTTNIPTLSFFFSPFELNFSVSAEAEIDSTGLLNVPGNWFSNLAVREFMVNAMPYTTLISSIYTSDGIVTGEAYGGVIPIGMGANTSNPDGYYPQNISWPSGNPTADSSTVGNVAWWWAQATTKGSEWYDPAAAACTSSKPCKFPIISLTGFSVYDDQANLWIASIKTLSGGDLQPYLLDIEPTTEAVSVGLPPGQGNMPDYPYGWAPDYPDPTDNIPTMFGPAGTYTVPDAVEQQLTLPANMNDSAPACAGHTTDLTSFAELVYWANVGQVPQACQGFAFTTMSNWINVAGPLTNVTQRILDYNLIEHIANELALYMYSNQGVGFEDYGSWINPATINTNPMIGGGGDQLWAFWQYSSKVYPVTVTETGLPVGTNWTATVGQTTNSSTSATITFPSLPNGTYNYSVTYQTGYTAAPSDGTLTVNGAAATVAVTFTAFSSTPATLSFVESGLVTNTSWRVVVGGYGSLASSSATIAFSLPASATYSYAPQWVAGYATPLGGTVALGTSAKSVPLAYVGIVPTYAINFTGLGLPVGAKWNVTLGSVDFAYTQSTTTNSTVFYEQNGTFPVTFGLPTGYVAPTTTAVVTVFGADVNVTLTFAPAAGTFPLTFSQSGMPADHNLVWNITIANLTVSSRGTELNFSLANGTYPWVATPPVSPITAYITIPASGTVVVNNSSAHVGILIQPAPPTYTVTFTTSSLPSGSSWTVYFGGINETTTGTSMSFSVENGSWTFAIVAPSGYAATPAAGAVLVSGAGATLAVAFAKSSTSSSPAWTYLSTLAYVVIAVLAVLVIVGFALAARGRGRKPTTSPPESWTDTSAKGAGGSGGSGPGGTPPSGGGSPPSS